MQAQLDTGCELIQLRTSFVSEIQVVIDDGDDGALEALLDGLDADLALFVDVAPSREILGCAGTWRSGLPLLSWVDRTGPWQFSFTSAPDWTHPPLMEPGLLPDLPAADAVVALAAALGWALPKRVRDGVELAPGRIATLAVRARQDIDAGRLGAALVPLGDLLRAMPHWRAGWRMAATAFARLGRDEEADVCRVRAAGEEPGRLLAS